MAATQGRTPYTWSVASGSLPSGLSLNGSIGVISGTPTHAGAFSFTVKVTDANRSSDTQSLLITIDAPPSITTTGLAGGIVGQSYSATVSATGGQTRYGWSIANGSLPSGLSLNSSSGVISGTPTTAGLSSFTVRVTDGNNLTDAQDLSITIGELLTITTTTLPSGIVGQSYGTTVSATGGTPPYTWSLPDPICLSLECRILDSSSLDSSSGVISWTPPWEGVWSVPISVTDENGLSDAQEDLSITVYALLSVTTTTLPNGTVGQSYGDSISATGGTPPYSWSVSSGSLPSGLSLDSATGVISGTPTNPGPFPFTVMVTDTNNLAANLDLTLTVNGVPAAPSPYSPTVGGTLNENPPFFDWSEPEHATRYELWVCEGEASCSIQITLDESEYTPPSILPPSTFSIPGSYLWMVRAQNAAGVWGPWGGRDGPDENLWRFVISEINMDVNPSSLAFGPVGINEWQTAIVVLNPIITNSSSSTGSLTGSVSISGSGFRIGGGGGSFSVTPGDLHAVSVHFEPLTDGAYFGTLEITHNATNTQNPTVVPFTGKGVHSSIDVNRSSLAFGTVKVATRTILRLIITNSPSATGDLKVSAGTGSPHFSIRGEGDDPFSITPGSQFVLEVEFFPLTTGDKSASLTIYHNATNIDTPISIPIGGSAVANTIGSCTYDISPTQLKLLGTEGVLGASAKTVSVTTQSGCQWTVENVPDWITIISAESGVGSETVIYVVDSNFDRWTASSRFATLMIAGNEFYVAQEGIQTGNPNYVFEVLNPKTWLNFRYGNWCGDNWSGGITNGGIESGVAPVDSLDLACRFHDAGWALTDDYWRPVYEITSTFWKPSVCAAWWRDRRFQDAALVERVSNLSDLNTNAVPDTWGYHGGIFGPHEWEQDMRTSAASAIIYLFSVLSIPPPC